METRELGIDDLSLLAAIDRSEHVEVEYVVTDGQLDERPVTMRDVPPWERSGDGPHSVASKVEFCRGVLVDRGVLLGCFDGARPTGLAIVQPDLEPGVAWLAFLHVSRPDRRRGVARALWDRSAQIARSSGARSLYVSATPTGSAVGFYLSQGCTLADPVHPALFAAEPHDVHLTAALVDPDRGAAASA